MAGDIRSSETRLDAAPKSARATAAGIAGPNRRITGGSGNRSLTVAALT